MSDTDFQTWRTFKPDKDGKPHGWIQWKGTDVCMDIHCACGALCHLDGEFAYYVKCRHCGRTYELSGFVELHEVNGEEQDPPLPGEPIVVGDLFREGGEPIMEAGRGALGK